MQLRRLAPVPTLSIITYHHVAHDDPDYVYDPETVDASPAQFRRQMELIARYCTPIGIDDLIRAVDGAPLPKNPVMVTFDDGYLSCHETSLPILRAVGVRATFFISTSFINERRLYWWERIALLVSGSKLSKATIEYPERLEIELGDPHLRGVLNALVKNTPSLDVERFLVELRSALEVEWNAKIEADYANGLIMTWDQIRGLARAGMDVESHGRRHRVLQTLDDATLEDELTGSRLDVEAQLGRPCRAIAYPVGRRISEARIRKAITLAGYRIGLSNMSGVNRFWPVQLRTLLPHDPLDMRRHATDRRMSDGMYLTQVAIPNLAYINNYNKD